MTKAADNRGFVTLFILMVSVSIFLSLGAAMGSNRALQRLNRKHAGILSEQARTITVTLEPVQPIADSVE